MPIIEKVEHEDLYLYEILRNPALFSEFILNFDNSQYDEEISLTDYQQEFVCDFNNYSCLCCSRAVGKCLDKDSMILDPTTGEYHTVKYWYTTNKLSKIISLNNNTWKQKLSKFTIEPNGIKDCIRITTQKGFQTIVTEEHPLLTNTGYVPANKLKVGDYIAVANTISYFGTDRMAKEKILALAHFIAEGTFHNGSISTSNATIVSEIYEIADYFNCGVRFDNRYTYNITKQEHQLKNEYLQFLDFIGIRNCHSYNKFIPQEIFRLAKEDLALFLNRLFSDDGWCTFKSHEVGYATTSEQIAKSLQHLLLRFGIVASLGYKENSKKGSWWLSIKGFDNLNKFKNNIGFIIDYKNENLNKCLNYLQSKQNQVDILPIPKFKNYHILETSKIRNPFKKRLNYFPSRIKYKQIIDKDAELDKFANGDIYWVKVENLEIIKDRETYAIEVPDNHNHLVDNIYSHNTFSLSTLILWLLVYNVFPQDYVVYFVPGKAQLDPVWTNMIRILRSNSLLKYFITNGGGVNSSEFRITLLNQAVLLCRIAGQSGTGANVIGLHTPFVIVDEAGYFPWTVFMEMQPIMNSFTNGYRLMVSGVPTGVRENNVLYHCDQENSNYTKHRVNSFRNPRFSEKDKQFALEQYGGEDSEDYIHAVLGQHGKPVFSLFDRSLFSIGNDSVYKLQINGIQAGEDLGIYYEKLRLLPSLPEKSSKCIFGIDLGYTEPTAISILYFDNQNRLHFLSRIQLSKVSYPVQEKFINALDTKYEPLLIGIDKGSAGIATIQHLMEAEEYLHKDFSKRVIPIDFSSWLTLGFDSDGKEIKEKTKPFTVSVLQDYCNNHKLVFSYTDLDMVSELERMTYSKNPSGDISYKTLTFKGGKRGEDHFTSALLCGIGAWHLTNEFMETRSKRIKLFKPGWI